MRSAIRTIQITNIQKQIVIGLLVGSEFATSITVGTKRSRDRRAMNIMFAEMGFGFDDKVERK
jgi:hypothetical protein